ncbi:hypothetical protein [Mucilaginibacter sp. UR6-11]|uniref:hypothetical protein n=1 Tax=Mucilaginibacter sp. UR6-11 TaxID=1435644 RepID=UPI001E2838BF|nr:hypothetical protein [Mucilaginibacter sp. UR6-11]MCC8427199.1 hypothetical protein [Mucilaginibacter sp. UR6-11]
MKNVLCMIALAAISFGSVYAVPVQQKTDTVKVKKKWKDGKMKMKKKMKRDTMMKKDTMKM